MKNLFVYNFNTTENIHVICKIRPTSLIQKTLIQSGTNQRNTIISGTSFFTVCLLFYYFFLFIRYNKVIKKNLYPRESF